MEMKWRLYCREKDFLKFLRNISEYKMAGEGNDTWWKASTGSHRHCPQQRTSQWKTEEGKNEERDTKKEKEEKNRNPFVEHSRLFTCITPEGMHSQPPASEKSMILDLSAEEKKSFSPTSAKTREQTGGLAFSTRSHPCQYGKRNFWTTFFGPLGSSS